MKMEPLRVSLQETVAPPPHSSGLPKVPWNYIYPASLDHIISVTHIGGENPYGSAGNAYDVHDINTGDTCTDVWNCLEYQHNPRVDIAAPGYRVGGLTYDPSYSVGSDLRYYSHTGGWGTSFASPIVAGTLGLMLSMNPCLSPYQLEYSLKQSSRSVYGVSDNAYLISGSDRFNDGRIGSGVLDAEAAVVFVNPNSTLTKPDPFDCNDPSTQSLFIAGIEINSTCAPGFSSNGIKPIFKPIIVNGTPPYTYRWEELPDNQTTLDNTAVPNPTVIASYGRNLAYWRLTVYDHSQIQKVANRIIKVQLKTDNTYDLAMRDSYVDMLDQPNSQSTVDKWETNVWQSPDLWNRQVNDGIRSAENVEQFTTAPNFMYTRVRNVGCAEYNRTRLATLHDYWTWASTGENWAADWTSGYFPGCGGGLVPTGREITPSSGILIPTLQPGDTFITATPWYPNDPNNLAGCPSAGTTVSICGLARIYQPGYPNGGMFVPEVGRTTTNVINSNNCVTRNMDVVSLGHRASSHRVAPRRVYVGNVEPIATSFTLQCLTDRDTYKYFAGNLSEFMYVQVQLQPELFDLWYNAGAEGTYASVNAATHTITYDPSTPLRLNNISLPPASKYFADISFILREDVPVDFSVNGKMIHFRQLWTPGAEEQVYGDYSFGITIEQDETPAHRKALQQPVFASEYSVFPNPTSDELSVSYNGTKDVVAELTITDMSGRVVKTFGNIAIQNWGTTKIDLSGLETGIYLLSIADNKGYRKVMKITKTD